MSQNKCEYCDELLEDCYCTECEECGSKDNTAYDDGEGYPWNVECNNCGHWWDI